MLLLVFKFISSKLSSNTGADNFLTYLYSVDFSLDFSLLYLIKSLILKSLIILRLFSLVNSL